jgi:hypothetical protein
MHCAFSHKTHLTMYPSANRTMRTIRICRQWSRPLTLLSMMLCASVCCRTTRGFAPLATTARDGALRSTGWRSSRVPPTIPPTLSRVSAVSASSSTGSRKQHMTRLSHEEQYGLLRQVTESRRIRQVKQELQLASPTRSVTELQLSRGAGYGDLLHEAGCGRCGP